MAGGLYHGKRVQVWDGELLAEVWRERRGRGGWAGRVLGLQTAEAEGWVEVATLI